MTGYFVLVLFTLIVLVNPVFAQGNINLEKEAIKQADIDFSNYSKAHGFKDAFLKFMTDDVVLIKDNSYPIEGSQKIKELFTGDDGGYTLVWNPTFSSVSQNADFGYTYGLYEETYQDEKGNPVLKKGTYVTIWRKEKDGSWKFVFDTGHKGLEPQKK
jgi:ketosteroid isomerase-like protein